MLVKLNFQTFSVIKVIICMCDPTGSPGSKYERWYCYVTFDLYGKKLFLKPKIMKDFKIITAYLTAVVCFFVSCEARSRFMAFLMGFGGIGLFSVHIL